MKFKTNIKGWSNRYLDQKAVMRELLKAQRKGYVLTIDQQQFWDEIVSLCALYNNGKNIVEILIEEAA